ncbi:MAG: acetate/propionate family kinase [Bacteroidales bacterium]
MKIIVLNCGSSSIKYQFLDMETETVLARGGVEKIGLVGSFIKHETAEGPVVIEGEILDHQSGIEYLLGVLMSKKYGCISNFDQIDAVGHRVVHAGEHYNSSVLISDDVIQKLEQCVDLAPLHNPSNLAGIRAMKALMPEVPQVGVFDTAFHQSMPDFAYNYAIPHSLYTKYGVRRYGFHGTSHRFVAARACEALGRDPERTNLITCHLGNGSSITAIKNGKSFDTSMGMTPVEGLIMGTRCGDLDAGVLTYIMQREELDVTTLNSFINKHCGLIGISGVSSDMREIRKAASEGNERAKLAIEMLCYRVKKYIGSYLAAMGGADLLVFTGGIGENVDTVRARILTGMAFMGLDFDPEINAQCHGTEQVISKPGSKITIMVVPTNEELVIARDTLRIAREQNL